MVIVIKLCLKYRTALGMLILAAVDHSASYSVVSINNKKNYQFNASGYMGMNFTLGITNVQVNALKTVRKMLLLENSENFYQTSSLILIT